MWLLGRVGTLPKLGVKVIPSSSVGGKWLWQPRGGGSRNYKDPRYLPPFPSPQLKYCSHSSTNYRFIWVKNVLPLKFKYFLERPRLTLKWSSSALFILSSWSSGASSQLEWPMGCREGSNCQLYHLPLALRLLSCWWALAPTLILQVSWNFHSSGNHRKEKVLADSGFIFLCFGNKV